jgi:hypothetical protein
LQGENDRDENRFQRIDYIIQQYEIQAKKSEELLRNKKMLKKVHINETNITPEDHKQIIIDQLISEPESESQENSIKYTPSNVSDSNKKELSHISKEIDIINEQPKLTTSKESEVRLEEGESNLIDIDLFKARQQELNRRVNLYNEQKNSASTYERLYARAMEKNTKEKLKRIEKVPKANSTKEIPNATALEVLLKLMLRFCIMNILRGKNVQRRLNWT